MVLWEICCGPNSSLSKKMSRQGFRATRLTHERNFDLSSRKKVDQAISLIPHSQPTRVWASPRCTAVSFQDMNQRTPEQRHEFFSSVAADFALRLGNSPLFCFFSSFVFCACLNQTKTQTTFFRLTSTLDSWETQCSSLFFSLLLSSSLLFLLLSCFLLYLN